MNALLKDVLQHVAIHLQEKLDKIFYCFIFILFSLTKDLYLKEIAPAKNHYETCYDVIHFPSLDMFLWLLI